MKNRLKAVISRTPKTDGFAAVRQISVRERILRLLLGKANGIIVLIPGEQLDELVLSIEDDDS